jgi:hypothetical protein
VAPAALNLELFEPCLHTVFFLNLCPTKAKYPSSE